MTLAPHRSALPDTPSRKVLSRRWTGLFLAIAAAAVSPAALAQSPPPGAAAPAHPPPPPVPDAADPKVQAAALFAEGNRFLGEASYPEALEKFRAAYALFASPKLLLNIGTTLRQLGRNVEAARTYQAYLHTPDVSPERAAEVRRVLSEIDAIVGRVRIEVEPKDAIVRVDGEIIDVENGVASTRAEPGEHQVTVQKKGMSSAVQAIRVSPREESALQIRLSAPDKRPVIVVDTGESAQRLAGWGIAIASGASLVAGGVTGGLAFAEAAAVRDRCYEQTNRCDDMAVSRASTASALATTSTATLIAGVAALAVGVTLIWTAPPPPGKRSSALPAVRVLASGGAGSAGAGVEVAF